MDTPKYHTIGSKYDPDLSLKEIAKRIRADIKAAQRAGLPVSKVSVRCQQYSGGQSIRIEVKELVPTCGALYDTVGIAREIQAKDSTHRYERHTAIRTRITETLADIAAAYNFDNSDSMTDYFHVGFYCHPTWDHDLLRYERANAEERARQLLAHEAEHEHGAAWVDAYYAMVAASDYAQLLAGNANAKAKAEDLKAATHPDWIARFRAELSDQIPRAEQARVDAATARQAWEQTVAAARAESAAPAPADPDDELLKVVSDGGLRHGRAGRRVFLNSGHKAMVDRGNTEWAAWLWSGAVQSRERHAVEPKRTYVRTGHRDAGDFYEVWVVNKRFFSSTRREIELHGRHDDGCPRLLHVIRGVYAGEY